MRGPRSPNRLPAAVNSGPVGRPAARWIDGGRGAGVPGPFWAAAPLREDARARPVRTELATVNYNQVAHRSTTNVAAIARDND